MCIGFLCLEKAVTTPFCSLFTTWQSQLYNFVITSNWLERHDHIFDTTIAKMGAVSRTFDLQHRFDSWFGRGCITTLYELFTHPYMSTSSINWCRAKGSDTVQLGRQTQAWWKVMAVYCWIIGISDTGWLPGTKIRSTPLCLLAE